MQELRVTDPTDPKAVVRLKLTQGALGIADVYLGGVWHMRTNWHFMSGFEFERVPPYVAGALSEELAVQFHKIVNTRRISHAPSETRPSRNRPRVGDRGRAEQAQ